MTRPRTGSTVRSLIRSTPGFISGARGTAHERSARRHFQRSWDRAVARAGSDSHLDEINVLFASSR